MTTQNNPLNDLSFPQCAEFLGVEPSTIRHWRRNGLLPSAYQCGRAWYISKEALLKESANVKPVGRPRKDG